MKVAIMETKTKTQNTYNMVLLGDEGVGKTAWIKRIVTGRFITKYTATMGVEVTRVPYNDVTFEVYDCSGQEKFGGLRDGYIRNADVVIVFFDVTSMLSYKNVQKWINVTRNIIPDVPIIICGSKVDSPRRRVKPSMIRVHLKNNCQYYDISAKSNYNFEKPFVKSCEYLSL
jgi:GTP-binding nuclear protein Ran